MWWLWLWLWLWFELGDVRRGIFGIFGILGFWDFGSKRGNRLLTLLLTLLTSRKLLPQAVNSNSDRSKLLLQILHLSVSLSLSLSLSVAFSKHWPNNHPPTTLPLRYFATSYQHVSPQPALLTSPLLRRLRQQQSLQTCPSKKFRQSRCSLHYHSCSASTTLIPTPDLYERYLTKQYSGIGCEHKFGLEDTITHHKLPPQYKG